MALLCSASLCPSSSSSADGDDMQFLRKNDLDREANRVCVLHGDLNLFLLSIPPSASLPLNNDEFSLGQLVSGTHTVTEICSETDNKARRGRRRRKWKWNQWFAYGGGCSGRVLALPVDVLSDRNSTYWLFVYGPLAFNAPRPSPSSSTSRWHRFVCR